MAATWTDDLRGRIDELIDEYRAALRASLDGLTEEQARARLVPSKTTLLGLLKHVTYVEGVWFDQAVSGRTPQEIGIATSPDRSFTLTRSDTVESVLAAHAERCEASRQAMAALALDDTVTGRGERAVWALQLQVLRELAHHAGHADILREQLLAGADPGS
ncbi:DinB family protein [Nocardioides okcheonensis]|uniref:DinB family protein n=1 Tax=Nocardioides okcheonensis TaxID=2894081 RepID=UPI001E592EE9|nr:DinB family protein [Nocardioides okcheonensis]UFN45711.1 DinB family protein [Nocardioides okcheonensis]